ncbi:MAG: ECF RNA polymerase sigma-E factor [Firmicutes bacterium]|nr:ECF RNA polymerase sigma-E factor [Bacillota bacterium]
MMSELLELLRKGDRAAFEEMVKTYLALIKRRAMKLAPSWQEADDLVQESLLRAWLKVKDFRGESSFGTWWLRIMENYHIDTMRKKRRSPHVSLQSLEERDRHKIKPPAWLEGCASEKKWEKEEIRRCLEEAFSKLPAVYGRLIVQKELKNMSYEEMAAQLACTVEAVRCKLYRARKQYRVELMRLLGQCDLMPS